MAQSYAQVYIHAVFSTKGRNRWLTKEIRAELFAYLATVFKTYNQVPVLFGGVEDHVHLLFGMSRTESMAKIIEHAKTSSSKWIKEKFNRDFAWQVGYGAFGVSFSDVPDVVKYIEGQEEHHKKISFADEYRQLLRDNGIEPDEWFLKD